MTNPLDDFIGGTKKTVLTPHEQAEGKRNLMESVTKDAAVRLQAGMEQAQHLINHALTMGLSDAERRAMKFALMERIAADATPVPSFAWTPFKGFATLTATVLIVGLGGAGVSYAADSALPGDLLYPVKVNVNEPVRKVFAVTAEARARFEANRAEIRLEEAQTLADAGTLDAVKSAEIRRQLRRHLAAMRAELRSASPQSADDVRANIETSLKAHSSVLSLQSQSSSAPVADLIADLRDAAHETETDRVSAAETASGGIGTGANAGKSILEAEQELQIAKGGGAESKAGGAAERSLKLATLALADARTASGTESLRLVKTAKRLGKQARLIMEHPKAENAVKTATGSANPAADLRLELKFERQRDDTDATMVRLQLTDVKIRTFEASGQTSGTGAAPGDTEAEANVQEAKQLSGDASAQLDAGNTDAALSASDAALQKAEKAAQHRLKEIKN